LVKNYPFQQEQLSASGFLQQSSGNLTGSVQGPVTLNAGGTVTCGGVGPLTGSIDGQNVNFSLAPGGTVFNFTGTVSSDQQSMSGSYQAPGGGCYDYPTSGTWTASLIPPLNGSISGTLDNSPYMALLTGVSPPTPIAISGTLTQSASAGGSNASISGTITAVGYPCMTTAYLTGTISGQSVYLDVFNYNGVQIGTLGRPGTSGVAGAPATAMVTSGQLFLTGSGALQSGLSLGEIGIPPCPPIGQDNVSTDSADVNFQIQ
jgi:hypothetical protein